MQQENCLSSSNADDLKLFVVICIGLFQTNLKYFLFHIKYFNIFYSSLYSQRRLNMNRRATWFRTAATGMYAIYFRVFLS